MLSVDGRTQTQVLLLAQLTLLLLPSCSSAGTKVLMPVSSIMVSTLPLLDQGQAQLPFRVRGLKTVIRPSKVPRKLAAMPLQQGQRLPCAAREAEPRKTGQVVTTRVSTCGPVPFQAFCKRKSMGNKTTELFQALIIFVIIW